MEYDGKSIADSQFCVEYIKKKRGIDASKHLSPAERGIARAFQKLTEENLYWYLYNILESSFFILYISISVAFNRLGSVFFESSKNGRNRYRILIHFSPKIRVTEAIGVNDILYLFSVLIN